MQRSANNACLGEAKAWVNATAASKATGDNFAAYTAKACASGPGVTDFAGFTGDLTFKSNERGTKAEKKDVKCNAESTTCELVASS